MDRSLGTTAQPRIQDVTPQILKINNIYGASDYTNPAYGSSNRSLNYCEGGSITKPELDKVSIIPFALQYKDAVGLFGKENHFVKVTLNITTERAYVCYEEPGWECAVISDTAEIDPHYESALITREENADQIIDGGIYNPDFLNPLASTIDGEVYNPDQLTPNAPRLDGGLWGDYFPAEIIGNRLPYGYSSYVSIDLKNLKVGNKYIDDWFDVRLYRKDRKEHPYDKMYARLKDYFYIGFHARNTKRLPYNVECIIGTDLLPKIPEGEERYVNG